MDRNQKEKIQYLLGQWLEGQATKSQAVLLFKMLDEAEDIHEWESMVEELMAAEPEMEQYKKEEWDVLVRSIVDRNTRFLPSVGMTKRTVVMKNRWWWAAAAVVFIVFGLLFLNKSEDRSQKSEAITTDVSAPQSSKAQITLADGSTISIDSLSTIDQSTVRIRKTENGIVYEGAANEMVFNTLTNPRGSKVVNLTLSDGTKVWLNAESSLKYPVAFVGNDRTVEITGEAYFETSHLPSSFKVIANGITIEDLGTEFNVNSYEGTFTTLISGIVKIGSVVLKPGEQASGERLVASGVDIDEVLAWKNGLFKFKDASIEAIMKQIERWYDVRTE